jgi:hypothetical protein
VQREPAAEARQQVLHLPAAHGHHAAGHQRRLVERQGIAGVVCAL